MTEDFFSTEFTPDATLGGCIEIFKNVWPNPSLTIDLVEQECSSGIPGVAWIRAMVSDGDKMLRGEFQDEERTNLDLGITWAAHTTGSVPMQIVNNTMYHLLQATLPGYAARFDIQEPLIHEPYSMLKYCNGQEYQAHYDTNTSVGRAISAICYLNNNYVGGEIEFKNFNVSIKPEPGMLLLFPSNYAYRHHAHPVVQGTKYALVTWIRDRPFETSI